MAFALKFSISALVIVTWTFLSFVYSSRPEDGDVNALASLMELPARFPASLPGAIKFEGPKKKKVEPIEMNVVELGCFDRVAEAVESGSARWVRLSGKGCKFDADTLAIRNLSNGYMATIFPISKKLVTTDFIPLVNGENRIALEYRTREGAVQEKEFSLTRQ